MDAALMNGVLPIRRVWNVSWLAFCYIRVQLRTQLFVAWERLSQWLDIMEP